MAGKHIMAEHNFSIVDSSALQSLREKQVKEFRGTTQDGTEEAIVVYNANFVRL